MGYLHIALGSASELEFQLELCTALEYCDAADTAALNAAIEAVKRMLSRLILSLRERRRPA